MNPRIKALWVEHLRSNWYSQNFKPDEDGSIPLRTSNDRWSPFGVLCNIYAQEFPDLVCDQVNKEEFFGYEFFIPRIVAQWAGLKPHEQTYSACMNFAKPVRLNINDIYYSVEDMFVDGVPFYIIADAIEEKF